MNINNNVYYKKYHQTIPKAKVLSFHQTLSFDFVLTVENYFVETSFVSYYSYCFQILLCPQNLKTF